MTPAMQQYMQIKSKYPDCILLFRMGDFYETFYEDAKEVSLILNITLTARDKEKKIPMAGIPVVSLDNYLEKLVNANKKVVLVEQIEDPKKSVGIVKRDVVKIFTPSTTFLDENTDDKFLLSLIKQSDNNFDISFSDISQGIIYVINFENWDQVLNYISLIKPKEILILNSNLTDDEIRSINDNIRSVLINILDEPYYVDKAYISYINSQLKALIESNFSHSRSLVALLNYFVSTQLTKLDHINNIVQFNLNDFMTLESEVIVGLELFDGQRADAIPLLKIINKTKTAGGFKLLKEWLRKPLINLEKITERQIKINCFYELGIDFVADLGNLLSQISDISRISAKIGLSTVNPRDLRNLVESIFTIYVLVDKLRILESNELLKKYLDQITSTLSEIHNFIEKVDKFVIDNPPISIREGGIIKNGVSEELDELYEIKLGGKTWIKNFEINEIRKTGLNKLKVKFNKIFGYYIEVPKGSVNKVPDYYIRKQTLTNAERFITPELKEYETKVLYAQEEINKLEYKIFCDLVTDLKSIISSLQKIYEFISEIDVINSFAHVALDMNWVRPIVNDNFNIKIENGFHPVVDYILSKEGKLFVKNSYIVDENSTLQIITGPNMGGKSTYLRQIALIVLLAQVGSFVPAEKAEIGIVDKIFTRIGASDNLSKGESTFMIEMLESSKIVKNATKKSLVLLDEVGRGTSTFDGISIAWAMCEFFAEKGIKTLFATHYHELTNLSEKFSNIKNFSVKVSEFGDEIIFMHQIIPGRANKSYGIHVARIAGMPNSILNRANEVLQKLDKYKKNVDKFNKNQFLEIFTDEDVKEESLESNIELFKLIFEEIKNIDLNSITPIQALNFLFSLKNKIKERSSM